MRMGLRKVRSLTRETVSISRWNLPAPFSHLFRHARKRASNSALGDDDAAQGAARPASIARSQRKEFTAAMSSCTGRFGKIRVADFGDGAFCFYCWIARESR